MKEKQQQLLVEGNDDFHVISSLCQANNINESFEIIDCNGIDNIIKGFPIRLKSSELRTIGIVIDADTNMLDRWNAIKRILNESSLYNHIPDTFPSGGLILSPINDEDIKIGLWIMPNNQTNGMLEDFITFLVPPDDNLLPITDTILKDIENRSLTKYKETFHAKARIHTWLAWQENPGIPMGLAITKKYLTTTPQICQEFIVWINNLFNNNV